MWYVYLLVSGNRTYVGCTTNPTRRVRQHNGERKGGAKSTKGKRWKLFCWLEGFKDRREAMRWEKLIKMRARGIYSRFYAFRVVSWGMCPAHPQYTKYYQPPEGLKLCILGEIPE